MATRTGLTVNGINALQSELRRPARNAVNMRPVLNEIMEDMVEHERHLWETEGASVGQHWDRREGAQDHPLMRRSGRLYRSLTNRTASGAAVRTVTRSFLIFGTDVPYAIFHQRGTSRMPARVVQRFPLSKARQYNRMMQNYLFTKRPAGWRALHRG